MKARCVDCDRFKIVRGDCPDPAGALFHLEHISTPARIIECGAFIPFKTPEPRSSRSPNPEQLSLI